MRVGADDRGLRRASRVAGIAIGLGVLPAPALASEGPFLWYRSGEGCPDATAFLRMLEKRALVARVAGMGDAIDFVVTLSRDATHGWGRVERQTSRGTVAIRELESSTCEAVADGLALSLALAMEPERRAPAVPAIAPEPPKPPEPDPVGSNDTASPPSGKDAPSPAGHAADSRGGALGWRLGLQGGWSTLVDGSVVGGGPLVDVAPWPSADARGPTLRIGAWLTVPVEVAPSIEVWLLGGRFEACPWGLDAMRLEFRPCLGLELAALSAERAVAETPSDTALWAALMGHVRVAWAMTDAVALEAQTGVEVALGRHDFVADTPARTVAARTDAIGLSAGVGMSVHLP